MKYYFNNLDMFIQENNTTAEELAERSGVSRACMYRYISGERIPKLDVAIKICRCLGVDMYDIWDEAEQIRRTFNIYVPRLESCSRKNKAEMGRNGRYYSNFGYLLNSSRYDKTYFADALDVSRRVLYDYVDGNSVPDVLAAAKIEVLFGMDLCHIWPHIYENRGELG